MLRRHDAAVGSHPRLCHAAVIVPPGPVAWLSEGARAIRPRCVSIRTNTNGLLQLTVTLAMLDIEQALEPLRPTHPRRVAVRVLVQQCAVRLRRWRDDHCAQLGMRGEYTVEPDQGLP